MVYTAGGRYGKPVNSQDGDGYNLTAYGSVDKSDTASVATYINRITELEDKNSTYGNPFTKRDILDKNSLDNFYDSKPQ